MPRSAANRTSFLPRHGFLFYNSPYDAALLSDGLHPDIVGIDVGAIKDCCSNPTANSHTNSSSVPLHQTHAGARAGSSGSFRESSRKRQAKRGIPAPSATAAPSASIRIDQIQRGDEPMAKISPFISSVSDYELIQLIMDPTRKVLKSTGEVVAFPSLLSAMNCAGYRFIAIASEQQMHDLKEPFHPDATHRQSSRLTSSNKNG
eukprot:1983625-Pleurochrysis_carterae.AAC.1